MDCMDIYFTDDYCRIYEKNGEGTFESFYMECSCGKVIYKYLVRRIELPGEKGYFDITAPYGYGGPLFFPCEGADRKKLVLEFKERFEEYCRERNIVTEFIRFHPLMRNHEYMDYCMDVIYNRDTVYMDLSSPGIIWDNMHSKCRNRVRKAQKSGVVIEIDNSLESLGKFMELYYTTMKRNGADLYYYFSNNYFNNLFELLKDNAYIFNALYDGRVIASSVILKYGDYLNYHLSGTDYRYIRFAPVNLLLYEAALWGSRQGCKYFHLGGGYRENDDSLFEFKKKFSKDGISKFFIGRKIHDEEHYKILVDKWERLNGERKTERLDFFPLYRR